MKKLKKNWFLFTVIVILLLCLVSIIFIGNRYLNIKYEKTTIKLELIEANLKIINLRKFDSVNFSSKISAIKDSLKILQEQLNDCSQSKGDLMTEMKNAKSKRNKAWIKWKRKNQEKKKKAKKLAEFKADSIASLLSQIAQQRDSLKIKALEIPPQRKIEKSRKPSSREIHTERYTKYGVKKKPKTYTNYGKRK